VVHAELDAPETRVHPDGQAPHDAMVPLLGTGTHVVVLLKLGEVVVLA
jgi:hypothetical protein